MTHLLWPLIEPSASTLFFAAIMIAAFYGGLGPGILVSSLSAMAIDYYFVPPYSALELSFANVVRAGVFMLVAVMISWLNSARKRLMDDIRRREVEREELLTKIKGFNEELQQKVEAATAELSAANSALYRTQQRLTRSERMAIVGQMAASLAHEIGTPLNAISGHMELLAANHPHHADTQRRIRIINKQLDFIVGIVKSLLEWTHKRRIVLQMIDLNNLIEEALWLVGPVLDKRAIEAVVKPCEGPVNVYADLDCLQQVLLNLINNSIDAMPAGGRIEITLSRNEEAQTAEMIFRDTGTGIEPDAREHLFEAMWTSKTSGSGFGLAIVDEIMTDHGGKIEVLENVEGRGASFRLTLPLSGINPVAVPNERVLTDVA
ncbi:MAG: DUF4118 domain-containing protein [Pyrinomonadaceae bacterium]|nr:DUF4118 domain-containing protein [Pyrinomonadaceae bacterium]